MFLLPYICCIRFSNIEYQDAILKNIIKHIAQKVMAKFGFGYIFHDLKYFEVDFLS